MSGTIPLSMTQQMDQYGDPLAGGLLYFFQAGTVSTVQNAFKDSALTLPHPNPLAFDATGRVPQLFLADGLIKIRMTDAAGVVQLVADNVQVIGASAGGGGGGAIDATTIYQTGDLKPRYGVGNHTGWVRCNGRTIGSSVSGATEAQNNATQPLFEYLWASDPALPVLPSRGATAIADWLANKQMTLPDMRGRILAGLDDMGSTAAGRLSASYFFNSTVLGTSAGVESHILTQPQLPAVNLNVTIPAGYGSHQHYHYDWIGVSSADTGFGGGSGIVRYGGENLELTDAATLPQIGPGAWVVLGGSNVAHNNVQPTMVVTIYIKL